MKFDLGTTFMSGMTAPAHTEVTKRPETFKPKSNKLSLTEKLKSKQDSQQESTNEYLKTLARVR